MRLFFILTALFFYFGTVRAQLLPAEAEGPRQAEAEAFAREWLLLVDAANAKASFAMLTDVFKVNLTQASWQDTIQKRTRENGVLKSRTLRRIVWYYDPDNAPLPGTYAAAEFDSVYANAPKHFQYVVLHSLSGEPFRVMRNEVTSILENSPEDIEVTR
jgi:Protein of unknown function (DUF4019)